MDQYRADLHIHSRFSRATSKGLTPRHLAAWAGIKGLDVVATGDFTHPQWLEELREQLVPDSEGLLRLKDARGLEGEIPWLPDAHLPGHARFMLSAEISSIYKRGGKVRKVHNLVYVPTFEAAEKLNARLARVGNLASDGRPILGLDSRHLLEMVLETDPLAYLVPAHIWTPWFSLLGSKSGFDSVEECFGSLSEHIFALETGLSSDPEMNRLLSSLDRYRMVSNSDAHSGEKLGREANLFSGTLSYEGIYRALRGEGLGHEFLGTVEFFPEEGKYHLDGHLACGVVMDPHETRAKGGLCPVCGKPLTVGVLNRVMELADREQPVNPKGEPGFVSLIPLAEILSEIHGAGESTKKVRAHYARLAKRFGPELTILANIPLDDLAQDSPVLADAVGRMRRGEVFRQAGFDGQYGRIKVFSPEELARAVRGQALADRPAPGATRVRRGRTRADRAGEPGDPEPSGPESPGPESLGQDAAEPETSGGHATLPGAPPALNERQRHAAQSREQRLLVLAGPGTGKTHTLMARIRRLLEEGADPSELLVVTFTRRAAQELRERLGDVPVRAGTLHSFAYDCWSEAYGEKPVILSEEAARRLFAEVNPELAGPRLKQAWTQLTLDRERMRRRPLPVWPEKPRAPAEPGQPRPPRQDAPLPAGEDHAARYARQKASWNLADHTDLLEFWLEKIEAGVYDNRFRHVLVDEVQDLSPLQLAVIRSLAGGSRGFFGIGDPKQSVYGFRGASADVRRELEGFWPGLFTVSLEENYRSAQAVLDLAHGLFPRSKPLRAVGEKSCEIMEFTAPQGLREISWMAEKIRQLLGPTSATLAGARNRRGSAPALSPADIAVLVRFRGLMAPIAKVLTRFGVPCSVPEAEAFWADGRVKAILNAAGRFLGMADMEGALSLACPDRVLAKGPKEIAFYLRDVPPFEHLFWQGPEFGELCEAYVRHGGWAGLLSHVNEQSELELVGRRAEKVRVMTLHAAKGLEFEAVFLPALEDGILPFAGMGRLTGKLSPAETPPDEAEEERLLYVGLTRARTRLYLSHAEKRELYGRLLMLKPSRFLKKLDMENARRSHLVARTVRKEQQLGLI
ncbi:ATP-dependent DNA helicase PcrA [Fundidesulfovibrio magnetotacticus]|uniref:ATP-dependent DNA helicase PcrA n=1 Tax=Fundidesulfovibrio magnetotacticus TaxID=2730080 RepID=A0A6V8LMN2_9BACT|nr:UvrD-helicase domain-containing protein [Fundidesulfovibrio magnetotacticus]GFK93932.1 ATP-dependent DNA helicase PcrA [Fundidesulfovibrio magnetotacticus]